MTGWRAGAIGLGLLWQVGLADTAAAQEFLPRADFTFAWGGLIAEDPRFDWLGQLGVDFDVVDYGAGRIRFQTLVEGGLGRERRRYDLNHGNFIFDAAISHRVRPDTEVEAVIQHVSRHVVDRENPPAVSWNAAGLRVRHRSPIGIDGRVELLYATQPAFVDYGWIARAQTTYRRSLSTRLGLFATGSGEVIGVDDTIRGRDRVCGGRLEGGLRIDGSRAALELFLGYERRVDAFPTDRFRVRWITAGFRILSLP
jgi:hypothetical protein